MTKAIIHGLDSKILAAFSTHKHVTNRNSGNALEEMHNDLGVFTYSDDGFIIEHEDFCKQLPWSSITQLNVYKVDQLTIDRIDMEIIYGDEAFVISEELPGWYHFVSKTKEIFPTIPKDWDSEIVKPAFETNYQTIYKREESQ